MSHNPAYDIHTKGLQQEPRVPRDLDPIFHTYGYATGFPMFDGHGPVVRVLLDEVLMGRNDRNRIARECAELHSTNDDLRARLALLEPVALAAISEDDAEAAHDNPDDCGIDTRLALSFARERRSTAVAAYVEATRTSILADQ